MTVYGDFSTGVLTVEDTIAYFYGEWFVFFATAYRDDRAFLGLFFGGIRNDNTGSSFLFGSSGLYQNAVC